MPGRFAFRTPCNRIGGSPGEGSIACGLLHFPSEMNKYPDLACSIARFVTERVCCQVFDRAMATRQHGDFDASPFRVALAALASDAGLAPPLM
jgi:hypothetical protein